MATEVFTPNTVVLSDMRSHFSNFASAITSGYSSAMFTSGQQLVEALNLLSRTTTLRILTLPAATDDMKDFYGTAVLRLRKLVDTGYLVSDEVVLIQSTINGVATAATRARGNAATANLVDPEVDYETENQNDVLPLTGMMSYLGTGVGPVISTFPNVPKSLTGDILINWIRDAGTAILFGFIDGYGPTRNMIQLTNDALAALDVWNSPVSVVIPRSGRYRLVVVAKCDDDTTTPIAVGTPPLLQYGTNNVAPNVTVTLSSSIISYARAAGDNFETFKWQTVIDLVNGQILRVNLSGIAGGVVAAEENTYSFSLEEYDVPEQRLSEAAVATSFMETMRLVNAPLTFLQQQPWWGALRTIMGICNVVVRTQNATLYTAKYAGTNWVGAINANGIQMDQAIMTDAASVDGWKMIRNDWSMLMGAFADYENRR